MPIYSEYYETFKANLALTKQNEILKKIKKEYGESKEELLKKEEKGGIGGSIVDVSLAKDGSIRTYLKDKKEPIRSYADSLTVMITTAYKRPFSLFVKDFGNMSFFWKIITLLSILRNKKLFIDWSDRLFNCFPVLLKDEHWCQPVKELRRILKDKIHNTLIDAISLIIEYDSAYKYRMQDVLPLLDQSKLVGLFSTIKEINRVFNILIERDYKEMGQKWNQIRKMAVLAMLIPKIRKKVVSILKELNLKEIEFSKEDLYWVNQFPSYDYLGVKLSERQKINIKKYGGIC